MCVCVCDCFCTKFKCNIQHMASIQYPELKPGEMLNSNEL